LRKENFASTNRKTTIYVVIIVAFSLLGFRLLQLQIINHKTYNEKSADNSIRVVEQIPPRGIFYDRNMRVVVDNVPAYTLKITPAYYNRKLNHLIETVIGVDSGYINKILYAHRMYSKFIPIRIKRDIDFKVVSWVEENSESLPGVDYVVEMQRNYPANIRGSHVFGYTKEISQQQLKKDKSHYYEPGDYIGYTGIEKAYEKYLRGKKGYKYFLVNSRQRIIGRYRNGAMDIPMVKGEDLVLSLDANVQRTAEQQLKGKRGAVVAIQPKTGEILALASAPDFDLSKFSFVTSRNYLKKLYANPNKPLFDRATRSAKPPGSTFKIVEAIAALNLGVITPSTTIIDKGGETFYGRYFRDDAPKGTYDVITAIEKSSNVFFYNVIYKLGMKNWYDYARKFGFGQPTHIDIDDEVSGFVPNSQYYINRYGPNWPKSIMASLGIGQAEVSVTPIQLAQYAALIANDGITYTPHVVKGYLENGSRKFVPFKFKKINLGISKKIFNIVKKGMYLVVNGTGTATDIRLKNLIIAGKTGTAQNPHGKDNALFIGFAPYNNPQIAVAVEVENVGYGATYAAPIAQKVIESFLEKGKLNRNNKVPMKKMKNKILGANIAN